MTETENESFKKLKTKLSLPTDWHKEVQNNLSNVKKNYNPDFGMKEKINFNTEQKSGWSIIGSILRNNDKSSTFMQHIR